MSDSNSYIDIRIFVLWCTRDRQPLLTGQIAQNCRESLRTTCQELGIQILGGGLRKDTVRMLLQLPPTRSLSDVMRGLKGRSSHQLLYKSPELRARCQGQFWQRGYYACTIGEDPHARIQAYLQEHK